MRLTPIAVLAILLTVASVGCAGLTAAAPSRQTTPTPPASVTPSAREIDQAFISAMVLHHTAAVQLARIEMQRGQRAEVKQLAQRIISAQQSEIKQLQQIAQQNYNFTPSTTLPTNLQQGVLMGQPILMSFPQQIDDLKSAADPDMMFLQMMIPHHAMAIVQADTQMMYGSDQRLKAISQDIVSSQSREIGEMENMLQHH